MISRHKILFYAGILMYLISLFLPSFYTNPTLSSVPKSHGPGLAVLLFGWAGILDGIFAWFGNPILFLSWAFYGLAKNYLVSMSLAIIALLISSTFLQTDTILADFYIGNRTKIVGYGLGYWLFLSSQIATIIATIFALISMSRSKR